MVILQSHRTQNMILRCYSNVSAILRRHTKSCLPCFPYIYFPLLIHRIFYLLYMLCSIAPPKKKGYLVWSRGASSARARRAQAQIFVAYSTVGRTCSFLCLLPMVLKTRGLGTGTTCMRGSYVTELRLLAWLRERTVLVKSEHELHLVANIQRISIYYGGPVVHFSSSCISDSQLHFRFSSSCISDSLFYFRFSSTCILVSIFVHLYSRFSSTCILVSIFVHFYSRFVE